MLHEYMLFSEPIIPVLSEIRSELDRALLLGLVRLDLSRLALLLTDLKLCRLNLSAPEVMAPKTDLEAIFVEVVENRLLLAGTGRGAGPESESGQKPDKDTLKHLKSLKAAAMDADKVLADPRELT